MLILVCGLPGVGKTHFAKALAKKMGALHMSSDQIRMKELVKRTYSQEEKDKIYRLMADRAMVLLGKGDVILDATFYLSKYRSMMQDVAQKAGVKLRIIRCTLDESRLKERMEKRRKEKSESEADFEVYLKVKKEFEPIMEEHLEIDTALPLDDNLKKAIAWMKSR